MDHVQELGRAWLSNPEQEKLKRELPFIAEVLIECAKITPTEYIPKVKQVTVREERQRAKATAILRQEAFKKRRQIAAHRSEEKRKHDPRTGRYVKKKEA